MSDILLIEINSLLNHSWMNDILQKIISLYLNHIYSSYHFIRYLFERHETHISVYKFTVNSRIFYHYNTPLYDKVQHFNYNGCCCKFNVCYFRKVNTSTFLDVILSHFSCFNMSIIGRSLNKSQI